MKYFHKLLKLSFLIFILLLTCYTYIKFVFWEPSTIEQGSFAYFLKIPHYVKTYPVWEPQDEPEYKYRMGDGEKNQVIIISYMSNLEKSEILTRLESYNTDFQNINSKYKIDYFLNELDKGCEVIIYFFIR